MSTAPAALQDPGLQAPAAPPDTRSVGEPGMPDTEPEIRRRRSPNREHGWVVLMEQEFEIGDETASVVKAYVPVWSTDSNVDRGAAVQAFFASDEAKQLGLGPGVVISPVPKASWKPKPLRAPDRPAFVY